NTDPNLHPTPTPTPTIFITYPTPKSNHDFTNFVGRWVSHRGHLNFFADGKATIGIACKYGEKCSDGGYITNIQFTQVNGNSASGIITSTNYSATDDFAPGNPVTAKLNTDGTLSVLSASNIEYYFCNSRAAGEGLCGA